MRDRSRYAGHTVRLRADAAEFGGLDADVEDWFVNVDRGHRGWREADADGDLKAQGYQVRRAGLPDDDDVLIARVDGIRQLIHRTEIDGESGVDYPTFTPPGRVRGPQWPSPGEVGTPCPACGNDIDARDPVAVLILGPGADPLARTDALAGMPYEGVAIELHWACVTGQEQVVLPDPAKA